MSDSMSRNRLIEEFAKRNGLSQARARQLLDSLTDIINEQLARGGSVYLGSDLGRLVPKLMPPARRRSPITGELIELPQRWRVRFKAGARLIDRLNQ